MFNIEQVENTNIHFLVVGYSSGGPIPRLNFAAFEKIVTDYETQTRTQTHTHTHTRTSPPTSV